MKTKIAIVSLVVAFAVLAMVVIPLAKQEYSSNLSTVVQRFANSDRDSVKTTAYCLNPEGEQRTERVIVTAVIPNYDSVLNGQGRGLQDTVHLRIWYRSRFGAWALLTTAAGDSAVGIPPCSLTIISTSALLINADSMKLEFIGFDSAGTSGGGSNDSLGRTNQYYIDNQTTYLLYQEKSGR